MTNQNDEICQRERARIRQIAVILAEGYLRLIRHREANPNETGQSEGKGPQESPQEQLDSFGHQSDEWKPG